MWEVTDSRLGAILKNVQENESSITAMWHYEVFILLAFLISKLSYTIFL